VLVSPPVLDHDGASESVTWRVRSDVSRLGSRAARCPLHLGKRIRAEQRLFDLVHRGRHVAWPGHAPSLAPRQGHECVIQPASRLAGQTPRFGCRGRHLFSTAWDKCRPDDEDAGFAPAPNDRVRRTRDRAWAAQRATPQRECSGQNLPSRGGSVSNARGSRGTPVAVPTMVTSTELPPTARRRRLARCEGIQRTGSAAAAILIVVSAAARLAAVQVVQPLDGSRR
jgi:hypothetical protein